MSGYLAKRCPECGDQLPAYFEKCKYCGADLSEIEPSEYEPLDMTPVEVKPKKRRGVPRIKKWKGYEKFVVDATPEDPDLKMDDIQLLADHYECSIEEMIKRIRSQGMSDFGYSYVLQKLKQEVV